jgi:hypothetical protein
LHCGLPRNEEADELAKLGRNAPQEDHLTHCISYFEAKNIIKDIYK